MKRSLTVPVSELISNYALAALYAAYPPPKPPTKRKGKARGGKKESTTGADAR